MVCLLRLALSSFYSSSKPCGSWVVLVGKGYRGIGLWGKVRGELGEYLGGGFGRETVGNGGLRFWRVRGVSQTSGRSDSIMECVLHSFVDENEPDQDMIYEDFDQVDQLEMEELDLKWQMAMLSLRINRFEKKRTKDDYKQSATWPDLTEREEKKGSGEVEKVYGMMAGLHADNVVWLCFLMLMLRLYMIVALKFRAYQNAVKTLESQKDWAQKEKKEWKLGRWHAVLPPSLELIALPPYMSDIEELMWPSLQDSETMHPCDSKPQDQDQRTYPTCYVTFILSLSCPLSNLQAASVPAGSRNSPASVTADGSDPATSRNRPAVNSAGRPNPAGWSKRPAPISAGSREGIVNLEVEMAEYQEKWHIRTSKHDFENVTYVEELQHF
ncbi:hypothetical protein Tco_0591457 [Tanacetum coccineum]